MLDLINKLHTKVAGSYSQFNIHQRVLNTILFIAQFVIAIIFLTAIANDGMVTSVGISAAFFVVYVGFYLASRKYGLGKKIIPIYLTTGSLTLAVLYFFAGGIKGPIPIYFILSLVLSVTILKRKYYWTVFLGNPAMIFICYLLEYNNPDWVTGHLTTVNSTSQILVSVLVYSIIVGLSLVTLKNNFDGQINITNKQLKELEKAKERIQKARDEAEQSSRVKSDFLSTMSHEIRTPLNAVIGMTYMLINDKPREDQRENLSTLRYSAENLLTPINDVLDFSKIEAGKVIIEQAPFSFFHILKFLEASHGIQAKKKNIEFIIEADDDIPDEIIGDSNRLIQILNNLVSNAIKFTEEGSVTLIVKKEKQSEDSITLHFEVKDTGVGITKEAQEIIFDSFSQADSSITRKHGGTGLGLSITKNLVNLMGSEIFLESEPGRTQFSFDLTFAIDTYKEELETTPVSDGFSLEGISILIVDDNPINQQVASKVLGRRNGTASTADNGQEAVESWLEHQYDLILMDVRMPILDGIEATRQIRRLPNGEDPVIIALTASALYEERKEISDSGMNDFVTKPFDPDVLFSIIETWLNKKRQ